MFVCSTCTLKHTVQFHPNLVQIVTNDSVKYIVRGREVWSGKNTPSTLGIESRHFFKKIRKLTIMISIICFEGVDEFNTNVHHSQDRNRRVVEG